MNSKTIKGDIYGGITAAVIALPLALAFGVASGAGAVAGLYGAIILGFFASLFGGTDTQISGPTGPMTVVTASAVSYFVGDINAVMMVILLAGIFQIVFGMLKLGQFVRFIPYPVISGFMSGIGVIIIILEVNPYFGTDGIGSVLTTLYHLPNSLMHINLAAFLLASLALAVMFFTPKKIALLIPPPLLALLIATILSIILKLDVKTVGEIPLTLPDIKIPNINWHDIHKLEHIFSLAFTLALLGVIDTLLTSLVADSITKTKHKPNKELIGQGIGNSLVALVGGVAGAGATMRTVINIKSGGSSRLSGMVHAITLLLIILFFAPIAAQIPLSVLAGILVKVGIDIIDYRFLKVIKKSPKIDMIIMLVVFALTVLVNLIMAVGIGIVLAAILTVYRVTQESNVDIEEHHEQDFDVNKEKVRVVNVNGAFFFGSASIFEERVSKALDVQCLVINCLNVPFMDVTAVFTLQETLLKLQDNNIKTALVLKPRHMLKIKNLIDKETLKKVSLCSSVKECQFQK
jgi:SulP family sulfate permease